MADYDSVDFHNFSYQNIYEDGIEVEYDHTHLILSEVPKTACMSVLLIVAVVVNAVLLIQQYRNTFYRSAVRFMLINLAVVNIYCAFFNIITLTILLGVGWHWYAGDFMCKFVAYLFGIGYWIRPFSIMGLLMAYIAEQVTRRSGKTIALFFIPPAWICAVVLCIPKIAVHEVHFSTDKHMPTFCAVKWNYWADILNRMHYRLFIILGFIFPCLFTGILCCMYRVVGKSDSHANISYRATISGGSINDVTTESGNGSAEEYNNGSVEIMQSAAITTPSTTSATNIQPHCFIPLILAIVYCVMHAPLSICDTMHSFNYYMCMGDIQVWLIVVSLSSILVIGIIPVIWHLRRSSEDGFSFRRFI